ncbi:hypothetical protein DFH07DRAFT_970171 [Mycena maculata]|uniref:Uncharacterized protein n=1 Tax=Mycena maculata TaxID=230809 RepID=A0AAD7HSW8_9AGAR|nr:hypothetical protein DFH07DRAFT_970171 [Mycena maculata]
MASALPSTNALSATQSAIASTMKSLAAGQIASITFSAITIIILSIVLWLCVRQTRRRRYINLEAEAFITGTLTVPPSPPPPRNKAIMESSSSMAQSRQDYWNAQLRKLWKQLESPQGNFEDESANLEQVETCSP